VEKGFSMLTAGLKKKMDARRVADKKSANAAAAALAAKYEKRQEERSLDSTNRIIRRSEAEKRMRRVVVGGAAGVARVEKIGSAISARGKKPAAMKKVKAAKIKGKAKHSEQ
jgi:hypothetical protein